MMVDNLQLKPLSVQFCGELMPQALIEKCSIIDISNPYINVNLPRLWITRSCAHEREKEKILNHDTSIN